MFKNFQIKVQFMNPVLGTNPGKTETFTDFIFKKVGKREKQYIPAEDVVKSEQELIDRSSCAVEDGTTVFCRDYTGKPCLLDYQWKGFFKEAGGLLKGHTNLFKKEEFKKPELLVEERFAIQERLIPLVLPKGATVGVIQRPIRATDMHGVTRVALSSSEIVPAGATSEFSVLLMDENDEPFLRKLLAFGRLRGTGQWRNSGYYARFKTWLKSGSDDEWEELIPEKEFPKSEVVNFRIKFTDILLGTQPGDPELYSNFVGGNSDEDVSAETMVERGMTLFNLDREGDPCLMSYHWRSFIKEAMIALHSIEWSEISKVFAYRKLWDANIHVLGDTTKLVLPKGATVGTIERPLIAKNAAGKMSALAKSEFVPEGTTTEIQVFILEPSVKGKLLEAMAYGQIKGTGQWRNSGKGRFVAEVKEARNKWVPVEFKAK